MGLFEFLESSFLSSLYILDISPLSDLGMVKILPEAQKHRSTKIQFAKHKKIEKREDQWVNTLFLLRIGNKIPTKGVTETEFGAKMKGWTIQRLPHPGIHPIISHQTQTPLHNARRILLKGGWYSCLV